MRKATIEKELLPRKGKTLSGCGRQSGRGGNRIAVSFVGTWLGDRLILEASLRLHRRNCPRDYLIAILDKHDAVDFPYAVRRHFDELWLLAGGSGQKWNGRTWTGSPSTAAGRLVRDALIDSKVTELYTAWLPGQVPRNRNYIIRAHNCFVEGNYLRQWRFYPRLVVPPKDSRWARAYLCSKVNIECDAFIAVHVRSIPRFSEKNLDPQLINQIIGWLRTQKRFAFLLLGRDDVSPGLQGPGIVSFVGEKWPFDRTAAIIARTVLFIGGDSSLTHAAAGLGVPIVGLGYTSGLAYPFTNPDRYIVSGKGESPELIIERVCRFVYPLIGAWDRRKNYG